MIITTKIERKRVREMRVKKLKSELSTHKNVHLFIILSSFVQRGKKNLYFFESTFRSSLIEFLFFCWSREHFSPHHQDSGWFYTQFCPDKHKWLFIALTRKHASTWTFLSFSFSFNFVFFSISFLRNVNVAHSALSYRGVSTFDGKY
jgi:hypothetical protein